MTSDPCNEAHEGPMIERESDGRAYAVCRRCHALTYHPSLNRGPFQVVRDSIADGVERQGVYKLPTVILQNTAFRPAKNGPSFLENIKKWADSNLITFEEQSDLIVFKRDRVALLELVESGSKP